MARGVNKVILIGNLGQDPEVKYMPNGNAVTNVSIATSDSWKDKQTGQIQERTEWHRVVFFGRLAEIAGEYLRKGSKVYIEGALRTRKWQGQDGSDRYTTEIVVDMNGQMQMLDGRNETGSGGYPQPSAPAQMSGQAPSGARPQAQQPQRPPQQPPAAPQSPPQGFDNFDDDIPF